MFPSPPCATIIFPLTPVTSMWEIIPLPPISPPPPPPHPPPHPPPAAALPPWTPARSGATHTLWMMEERLAFVIIAVSKAALAKAHAQKKVDTSHRCTRVCETSFRCIYEHLFRQDLPGNASSQLRTSQNLALHVSTDTHITCFKFVQIPLIIRYIHSNITYIYSW